MNWTHTKAVYADAGNSYYKDEYSPFSIDQIRKHSCAFYIFHGLSPDESPFRCWSNHANSKRTA